MVFEYAEHDLLVSLIPIPIFITIYKLIDPPAANYPFPLSE